MLCLGRQPFCLRRGFSQGRRGLPARRTCARIARSRVRPVGLFEEGNARVQDVQPTTKPGVKPGESWLVTHRQNQVIGSQRR